MTAAEMFRNAVESAQIRLGVSANAFRKLLGMTSSHYCVFRKGQSSIGERTIRRACALANMPDADAWTLALSGKLPREISIDEAKRILDVLAYAQKPLPSKARLLSQLMPLLSCGRCKYEWRQRKCGAPRHCPHCSTTNWDNWSPEAELLHAAASKRSMRFWGDKSKPQRRALVAARMDRYNEQRQGSNHEG